MIILLIIIYYFSSIIYMKFKLITLFGILFLFSCQRTNACYDLLVQEEILELPDGGQEFIKKTYLNDVVYTGKCETFYDDLGLQVDSQRQYKNGLDHGKWTFHYPNGEVETTGRFRKGKRIGTWKYYYEDGTLSQISKYQNGLKHGTWKVFSEKGELLSENKWVKGVLN
jgi:antitoxin component YwqK of YwqJK toxin-antitoxin module